jgi:predicted metal-dependent hydrolase
VIEYQVLRSHRKTLSLQVRHGQVLVRAPHYVDEKFISTFIQKKSAWLKAKITEQSQADDFCCDFSQGSMLFLFGQLVTLHITFAKKAQTLLTDDSNNKQTLTIVLAERNQNKLSNKVLLAITVKKHIEHYFKQQAEYRSRWGSCNNRGELSFNSLLMMLPIEVINYVVVHELCHLQHLNHSKEFWQLVANYLPHFNQSKQWVKNNKLTLLWRLPLY